MAAKKRGGKKRGRSAITGRFVKVKTAKKNPRTTVLERVKKKRKR